MVRGGIGEASGDFSRRYALIFAAGLIAFYAAWVILWLAGEPATYFWALRLFGTEPVVLSGHAMPVPFFDLQGVLSWPECARRGIDVFVVNPCDLAGRPANYSPLLTHPMFGDIGTARTLPIGAAIDLMVLALLPFVIRPRNGGEVVLGWLVACSPAVFYALERCNIDVIVFSVAVLAILVTPRAVRQRLTCVAGFLLGFVKFYPFCLLLLALRERLRVFLAVAGLAVTALVLFVFSHRHAFSVMAFPGPDWFGDTFSAEQIAYGIADLLGIKLGFALPILAVLAAICGRFAWKLSGRFAPQLPPAKWEEREYLSLLFAAVVMVSCFTLQSSLYYRAIFLVAAVPGLWRLREHAQQDLRRFLGWSIAALVACLWAECVRVDLALAAGLVPAGGGRATAEAALRAATLLFREGTWWFTMSVLAALILAFVRQSQAVGGLSDLVWRKYGGSGGRAAVVSAASHDPDRQA